MTTLGLAMIVCNEEKLLPQCLDSIKDIVQEYSIGLDKKSNDGTEQFLKANNIPYHNFEFINFSTAINESILKLKTDWILAIAADEMFCESDKLEIKKTISNAENYDCYGFKRRDWYDLEMKEEWLDLYPDYQLRLFQNHKNILFAGQVHESLQNCENICWSDITIQHFALYLEKVEPERLIQKRKLYTELGNLGIRQSIDFDIMQIINPNIQVRSGVQIVRS